MAKQKNRYSFRSGRSVTGLSPQKVGEELERIRAKAGALTPAAVLEAATDEKSPLHGAFEWDDSEAAGQFRLQQARKLIVSIKVINSEVDRPAVAYLSVRSEGKRQYVPTQEVMSNDDLKARMLDELRTFIDSLERRYGHLVEIGELVDGLKEAIA